MGGVNGLLFVSTTAHSDATLSYRVVRNPDCSISARLILALKIKLIVILGVILFAHIYDC